MKKLLALLMVVATLFCVAACGDEPKTDSTTTTKNDTTTTTTAPSGEETTTAPDNGEETTTAPSGEETTAPNGEETTAPNGEGETTTTTVKETTTTTIKETTTTTVPKANPVVGKDGANINGVNPADAANQNKVVDGVFTSSNGGIQLSVPGWKTYNLYSISMVPETYANAGQTNAICVAVYPKGTDGYDSTSVFENKTQKDFEDVLKAGISYFGKTTITSNGKSYTCYQAIVTDAYYVWVFQTPEAKYFINFMQAPLDNGGSPFKAGAESLIKTIQIYK